MAAMVVLLQSERLKALGIPHGFSTREGGVSLGPYASLNVARAGSGGDDPAAIAHNLERLSTALGGLTLSHVTQVHGTVVVNTADATPHTNADGLVVTTPGTAALITVADCAPVLLARKDGTAVAAVHAGWRGAVGRITSKAVAALGTTQVVVVVGPCIGPCCFEVGPEVAEAAVAVAGPAAVRDGPRGKPHVDLWAVVTSDALSAGVAVEDVEAIRRCTQCDTAFFSHRRDAGVTGRQAGVVGLTRRIS